MFRVVDAGRITITNPIERYYRLKQESHCPSCASSIHFFVEKRMLRAQCTPDCESNMEVAIPPVSTYEAAVKNAKRHYDASAADVLHAKFDFLFKYADDATVDTKKNAYLASKRDYTTLKAVHDRILALPVCEPIVRELKKISGPPLSCSKLVHMDQLETRLRNLKYKGESTDYLELMPYTLRDVEVH